MRIPLGIVVLVFCIYVGTYAELRFTHQIRCSTNAWNWHPEKWDLAHHFQWDSKLLPWTTVFKPLMLAEEAMRASAAWMAHEVQAWLAIIGMFVWAGLIVAIVFISRRSGMHHPNES